MLPIFVFLSLPTLSIALLCAILIRRWQTPLPAGYSKAARIRKAMSRIEALHLLGLDNEKDPRKIKAAYTRLMNKYHPDHGGSHQAAATLNQARDILLRRA
jgi:preprotein translocase subunit Sec63